MFAPDLFIVFVHQLRDKTFQLKFFIFNLTIAQAPGVKVNLILISDLQNCGLSRSWSLLTKLITSVRSKLVSRAFLKTISFRGALVLLKSDRYSDRASVLRLQIQVQPVFVEDKLSRSSSCLV